MGTPTDPTESTLKVLLALSGNQCAFYDPQERKGCEEVLAKPSWPRVKGKVCHIAGAREGSARYDPSMTDGQRRHFSNLIVLCPTHHEVIDYLEPERFTVDVLQEMKERHERANENAHGWVSEGDLRAYVTRILYVQFGVDPSTVTGQADITLGDSTASGTGEVASPGPLTTDSLFGSERYERGSATEREGITVQVRDGDSATAAEGEHVKAFPESASGFGQTSDATVRTEGSAQPITVNLEPAEIRVEAQPLGIEPESAHLNEDGSSVLNEDGGKNLMEGPD